MAPAPTQWIALVRNVMLGREGLSREHLLDLARAAGASDVRSHITTGNLTFASDLDADTLADRLERGVEQVIGRREMVAVRPLTWVQTVVGADPFSRFDPTAWSTEVALLRHDAAPLDAGRLDDPQRTVIVEVREREVLAARPREGARRPHVNRLTERATGLPATSRGWTTVLRLAAT